MSKIQTFKSTKTMTRSVSGTPDAWEIVGKGARLADESRSEFLMAAGVARALQEQGQALATVAVTKETRGKK